MYTAKLTSDSSKMTLDELRANLKEMVDYYDDRQRALRVFTGHKPNFEERLTLYRMERFQATAKAALIELQPLDYSE